MTLKKILPSLVLGLVLIAPSFARAEEPVETRIANLRARIEFLRSQLNALGDHTHDHDYDRFASSTNSGGDNNHNNATTTVGCVDLKHNFSLFFTDRKTDGEVTKLQDFLRSREEADWNSRLGSTGFFGLVTKHALGTFQINHNLITPDLIPGVHAFHYGELNNDTRAFIKDLTCGNT